MPQDYRPLTRLNPIASGYGPCHGQSGTSSRAALMARDRVGMPINATCHCRETHADVVDYTLGRHVEGVALGVPMASVD